MSTDHQHATSYVFVTEGFIAHVWKLDDGTIEWVDFGENPGRRMMLVARDHIRVLRDALTFALSED